MTKNKIKLKIQCSRPWFAYQYNASLIDPELHYQERKN